MIINQGAASALQQQGVSLLAVGVTAVHGDFQRGDLVYCKNQQGEILAKGLINYNTQETLKIQGTQSKDFAVALGYSAEPELIHRDNMVVWSG